MMRIVGLQFADYMNITTISLNTGNSVILTPLRLEQISKPERKIENIIIASLPDLPRAFELYAQKLEDKGTKVDVLVWNPAMKIKIILTLGAVPYQKFGKICL